MAKKSKAPTDCKGDQVGRNDPCPCGSGKNIKLSWESVINKIV